MSEPEHRRQIGDELERRIPASSRGPERLRFQAVTSDVDEDDDEDVRLLAELAEEAERTLGQQTGPRRVAPRLFKVKAEDQLEVFRETRTPRTRPRVLEQIDIADIEMADLIEELATTAAALRRRRAA
jgi:hypothetical protein